MLCADLPLRQTQSVAATREWETLSEEVPKMVDAIESRVDTLSGKTAEILSVAPDNIAEVAISRDGRRIWFARGTTEGDIWMATLK